MWLAAAVMGLFGIMIGSFLNVVVFRVPRKESIISPRSRCPSCGTELRTRDNIPLFSWIALKGRCRSCGEQIGGRYPLIELANGALWIAAALRFERPEEAVFVALFCSVLLALSAIDLEHKRLPNVIVLPSIVVALIWIAARSLTSGRWGIIRTAVECGLIAFAIFFVIALVSGGMGFGDVKLAGLIGLVAGRFGWEEAAAAVLLSFFAGGFAGLALLVTRRKGRKQTIPFGPALAFGGVLALFLGAGPVHAWLGL